jgi:hypothetical protein
MKENLMLDLETMDTGSGAAIISIGAVYFDKDGLGEDFYEQVNLESCLRKGLTVGAATVMWWMQQSDDARKMFHDNHKASNLSEVLCSFFHFIRSDVLVWGNGSDFDNVVLANAYRATNNPPPWSYKNNRCFRTLRRFFSYVDAPADEGVCHNALDDARWQAKYAVLIFNEIDKNRVEK